MEQSVEQWADWEPCESEMAVEALSRLSDADPRVFADATIVNCRLAKLSFYAVHQLLELRFTRRNVERRAFVLHSPDHTV